MASVTVLVPEGHDTSPWLGGVNLSDFNGSTFGERIAQAAHVIAADILSPIATATTSPAQDPEMEGYETFTTPEMVKAAHNLGLHVKPWTVRNFLGLP